MTTRDIPFEPGTPCWVDLFSSDLDASKNFYGELFGWEAHDSGEEFGGYVSVHSDGRRVAGMMKNTPESGSPDVWSTYISTDDIEATSEALVEAGGQVMFAPDAVADLGSMAIVVDPAGAAFGLWQPGTHLGFTKYNEPGSVTWDEHHSKDFRASTPFYEKVFGWQMDTTNDSDEFRYYQAKVNGEVVAGLMDSAKFLPAEVPSHWAVYFGVEDADEAAAKVTQLGGSVIRGPEDTPYGRLADVQDPTGAAFKLHSNKLANP
jgi:predicted enzyme related to lactoylglutathione lyase